MPIFVAGYYLSFATTRRVMAKVGIPDKGAHDDFLEFPINDWLARNLKERLKGNNVLAGAIAHSPSAPREDGILLMTKFIRGGRNDPQVRTLVAQDSPKFVALKQWLINEGGAEEQELKWVAMWDDFQLTRCGIAPRQNDKSGPTPRLHVTKQMLQAWQEEWKETKILLNDFLQREVDEGRAHISTDPVALPM